jgi:hypothetical protein
MSKRFHLGTRGPSICSAQKGNCPFGGDSGNENHFNTMAGAAEAYEQSMGGSLSAPLQKDLLEDSDSGILEAAKEDIPRGRMAVLAKHEDQVVRRVVAASNRASVSILRRLASDKDEETRAAVASNANTDEKTLSDLLADKKTLVSTTAALNPKTPRASIEKVDVENNLQLAIAVATNNSGNVSVRMFKKLAKIDDNEVQDRLASNGAAPDSVVTNAVIGFRQADSLMENHPNPPATAVEAAWQVHTSEDRIPDVNLYISHDSTPKEILDEISKDPRYSSLISTNDQSVKTPESTTV